MLYYATDRRILKTSGMTALVVGTILGLLNHFQNIFSGNLSRIELIQILVTYCVPFSVATFGATKHAQRLDQARSLSVEEQRLVRDGECSNLVPPKPDQ